MTNKRIIKMNKCLFVCKTKNKNIPLMWILIINVLLGI
jgi:hypothetical protein